MDGQLTIWDWLRESSIWHTDRPQLRYHPVMVRLKDGTEVPATRNDMGNWLRTNVHEFYRPEQVTGWRELTHEEWIHRYEC